MSKLLELASKYSQGIYDNDKENLAVVAEVEKTIAKMASTEQGRAELAEIVSIALEDAYNKFDIAPLLFETRHFNYGDKPTFKTHKKGIVAYWTAPNSYVPKSRNYSTEVAMEFENLGVRPEALLSELKTGRLGSLAGLIANGKEAIEVELLKKPYEIVAQTYNAQSNTDNYFATNELNEVTLDAAISKIRKKIGGNPAIIGDYDLCTKIEKFDGYADNEDVQREIRNHGFLGRYRGCPVIYLPEILNEVTGESSVPQDKLFVVGRRIGVAASYGDQTFEQEKDINDMSWNCRIDKEVGYCVTRPEGICLIEVTG